MKKKLLSKYSIVMTPILILGLIIFLSLRNIPEVVYINNWLNFRYLLPKISTFNKLKYKKIN